MDFDPEDFQCNICLQTFDNPHVDQCGHTFCKDCITEWLVKSPVCPISKINLGIQVVPNLIAKMVLESLGLKCANSKNGCSWKGKIKSYENFHKDHCAMALFPENAFKVLSDYFENENGFVLRENFELGKIIGVKRNDEPNYIGVVNYSNGDLYKGLLLGNTRHGVGKFHILENKERVEGEWLNDRKNGFCVIYNNNKIAFEGKFENDLKQGKGVLFYNEGILKAEFEKDQILGVAQIKFPNGNKYIGKLENLKPHGEGKYVYIDGSTLKGNFESGKRTGRSMVNYFNGDIFEGTIDEDRMNGNGVMTYFNGDEYVGDIKIRKRDGQGTLTLSTKVIQEGNWINDKMEGECTVYNIDGSKITCIFGEGYPKYQTGRKVLSSGTVLEGFVNSQLEIYGKVKMKMTDGAVFEGIIERQMIKGKGKMIMVNGDVYSGNFVSNKLFGNGQINYANGNVFKGNFSGNLQSGNGALTIPKEGVYSGNWNLGILEGDVIHTDLNKKKVMLKFFEGKIIAEKPKVKPSTARNVPQNNKVLKTNQSVMDFDKNKKEEKIKKNEKLKTENSKVRFK